MYGKTAAPCRVQEYGSNQQPTDGHDAALVAMRGRVTLWNRLVEIERAHVAERDQAIAGLAPDVAATGARLLSLEADESTTAEQRKAVRREYREARKAAFARDDVKAAVQTLDHARREAVKTACRESGLYWCNYDDVVTNYERARRRPGDLRFHAWRNETGKVTVRFQTGLPVADAFAGDTRLQIDPVPDAAWAHPSRGERRRLQRTRLRLRVASDNRAPVWLELPVMLHRPLPARGVIRSASVYRERLGTKYRWKATITVALPDAAPRQARGQGMIAIDLGWRRVPDGLRVAAWHDTSGRSGQIVLPNDWIGQMDKLADLQSLRDQHFNAARAGLAAWLRTAPGAPEWLREATSTLAQWRSPARLAGLALRWRENRYHADAAGYELVEQWRRRDKHLLEWQVNQRDRLLRDRRERYRLFAAWIAREYQEVRLETFDLRRVLTVEATKDAPPAANYQRTVAAPSVLRLAIENACAREGVTVTRIDARNTTRECHACGAVNTFDAVAELVHRCEACGVSWDQDDNAARVLLRREVSQTPAANA